MSPNLRHPQGHTHLPARLLHSKRVRNWVLLAVVVAIGLHFLLPELSGLGDTATRLRDADPWWLTLAVGCTAAYLGAYIVTFHGSTRGLEGVPPRRLSWRASYDIVMAGQAASTVITAAGAGGIALQVWAIHQAGATTREAGRAVASFLVYHYAVFLVAVALGGIGLYVGIIPGDAPTAITLVPGIIAALLCVLALVIAAIPERIEARLEHATDGDTRLAKVRAALLGLPASLSGGMRLAWEILRGPGGTTMAIAALLVWITQIVILWSCLRAFGVEAPLGPVTMAFFIGTAANLLPLLPGGVGSVEAGLIGALVAFDEPASGATLGVLSYRLISYWLPTIPEVLAYFGLRHLIAGWRRQDGRPDTDEAPGAERDDVPAAATA